MLYDQTLGQNRIIETERDQEEENCMQMKEIYDMRDAEKVDHFQRLN